MQRIGPWLACWIAVTAAAACSDKGASRNKDCAIPPEHGVRLVYTVDTALPASGSREQMIATALHTIRERINALSDKLSDASVLLREDEIVVELVSPSRGAHATVRRVLERRAMLQFRLAHHLHPGMDKVCRRLESDAEAKATAKAKWISVGTDTFTHPQTRAVISDLFLEADDREALEGYVASVADQLELTPAQTIVYERPLPISGGGPEKWRNHVINQTSVLRGQHIKNASVGHQPETMLPNVRIEFDDTGTRLFALITKENVGTKIIMTLDGQVVSAPLIRQEVTEGSAVLTIGAGEPQSVQFEAQDIAIALRSGALPAPLRLKSEDSFEAPAKGCK